MTVKDLFQNGTAWTQRAFARKADGSACRPYDADAVCWSLDGAVQKVYDNWKAVMDARLKLQAVLPQITEAADHEFWQDTDGRTFVEVLTLIEKAGV